MRVVGADPRASFMAHRDEIEAAVAAVLEGGSYILGPQVDAFESEFAAYIGTDGAAGVASGTDALAIALAASGVKRGDLVVTVSHTATATVAAIEMTGAQPVLVDIDPRTYTMDPELLERTLRSLDGRVKAVVPVHLYGHPADIPSINRVAEDNGAVVVEDCAQAHGAAIDGQLVGGLGTAGAFSFYPTKNLGAIGDGGAVVGDSGVVERARELREYGWRERFVSLRPGVNSRLDEIQAAVLRVKLRYLRGENGRRQGLAAAYQRLLASASVACPSVAPGREHVYHQYVVTSDERDGLRQHLLAAGVGTGVHYPVPVHRQPAYDGRIMVGVGGLDVTEGAVARILSLPVHPQLSDDDVGFVADQVVSWSSRASV